MRTVTKEKCQVCGKEADFVIDESATLLREAICNNCGASIRTSDIAGVIKEIVKKADTDKIRILNLSSQGKIHEIYSHLKGYTCGEYFDGVPSGSFKDDVMCIDLQNMPFDDESFDLIVTEDVLEHVWDINKALKEINRVLKNGGNHVFTVPIHENMVTMSRKNNPIVVYHGDPLRPEGAKVITDFGRDIDSFIDKFGMKTVIKKLHSFHSINSISVIDDEVDYYINNRSNFLSIFRYNSIVMISKRTHRYRNSKITPDNNIKKKKLAFTGERYVPEISEKFTLAEHYQRYYSVLKLVRGKKVLDAACGTGYGSALIASVAETVMGIDISSEAIDYAQKHYGSIKNLKYIQSSIENIPFPDDSFDVIVSFETIEHITEPVQNKFLSEIRRCLMADGLLVMSTPDKNTYSDIPKFNNEFHLKEFYYDEFDDFLHREFKYVNHYIQGAHNIFGEMIHPVNKNMNQLIILNEVDFDRNKDLYIISVCSDREQDLTKEDITSFYNFLHQSYVPYVYLYINNCYTAANMIAPELCSHEHNCRVRFNLSDMQTEGRLRFDPLEGASCIVELLSINTDAIDYCIVPFNAFNRIGSKFVFLTEDPIIEFIGDFSNATYIEFEYRLQLLDEREILIFANQKIKEDIARLEECKKTIRIINEENEDLQKTNENLQKINENYQKICGELTKENEALKRTRNGLTDELEAIKNTRTYRVLEKIRQVRRKLNE